MKQDKSLNKSQLPEPILTTIPLNIKLNMFLKLATPNTLNMFLNKNLMLNKSQFKEPSLNTFQKPDTPPNIFHNKDKLKT